MKTLVTKRNIALIGLIGTLLVVATYLLDSSPYCNTGTTCARFIGGESFWNIISFLMFTFPVLFLSLITYKMRDEIFHAWFSFAKWWVPISIIIIFLTPAESGGFISIMLRLPLAFSCAIALLVISLIIIAYKSYSLRGK